MMNTRSKTDKTTKASEEPEIYRNLNGNPMIYANRAQAQAKAKALGEGWSVHQSPQSRRFYVRKLTAGASQNCAKLKRMTAEELASRPPMYKTTADGRTQYLSPSERREQPQAQHSLDMDEHDPLLAAYNDGDGDQRQQAQHSPLLSLHPQTADRYSPEEMRERYAKLWEKHIATERHAEALAEALRDLRTRIVATGPNCLNTTKADETLANWEGAKN